MTPCGASVPPRLEMSFAVARFRQGKAAFRFWLVWRRAYREQRGEQGRGVAMGCCAARLARCVSHFVVAVFILPGTDLLAL